MTLNFEEYKTKLIQLLATLDSLSYMATLLLLSNQLNQM